MIPPADAPPATDLTEAQMRTLAATDPDVAAALSEVADADATADHVEAAIVAGDDSVGLEQLEEAEKRGRLARLNARRIANKVVRERETTRQQRIADHRELIRTSFGTHEGDILAAFDQAVDVLGPLIAAVLAHNDGLRTILHGLSQLGELPQDLDTGGSGQLHLPAVDVFVTPINLQQLLAEACSRAAHAAGVPGQVGELSHLGGVGQASPADAARHGIQPRADGAPGLAGPTDRLRRTARIVAGGR